MSAYLVTLDKKTFLLVTKPRFTLGMRLFVRFITDMFEKTSTKWLPTSNKAHFRCLITQVEVNCHCLSKLN